MPGRAGAVRLAEPPKMICIGIVVRYAEGASALVECFDLASKTNHTLLSAVGSASPTRLTNSAELLVRTTEHG